MFGGVTGAPFIIEREEEGFDSEPLIRSSNVRILESQKQNSSDSGEHSLKFDDPVHTMSVGAQIGFNWGTNNEPVIAMLSRNGADGSQC